MPARAEEEDISYPRDLPAESWWQIARRVAALAGRDDLNLAAAGVAFYAMLSLFPAMAAIVSVYSLTADPVQIADAVTALRGLVSPEVRTLLSDQLVELTATSEDTLSLGLFASLGLALWSANRGMKALISAINIAYAVQEDRGIIRLNALSLGMTALSVLGVVVSMGALVAMPAVMSLVGLGETTRTLLRLGRWPLLLGGMLVFLAVVYRFTPSRKTPRWRWITPGALLASGLWAVLSAGFAFYTDRFGQYSETYGTLGAAIITLVWLYITGFAVAIGAGLNAAVERQAGAAPQQDPS